jgi:hypothetical protein
MSSSLFGDAVAHPRLATLRGIDVCLDLSLEQLETTVPGTYGSILDTMRHTVGADSSYLFVMSGGKPPFIDEDHMDLSELRAVMEAHGALVLKRFAGECFGWDAPVLERIANAAEVSEGGAPMDDPAELSDPDSTGPLRVLLMGCAPAACPAAYITVQRLIRDDPSGIWSVTAYDSTTVGFPSPSPSPVG